MCLSILFQMYFFQMYFLLEVYLLYTFWPHLNHVLTNEGAMWQDIMTCRSMLRTQRKSLIFWKLVMNCIILEHCITFSLFSSLSLFCSLSFPLSLSVHVCGCVWTVEWSATIWRVLVIAPLIALKSLYNRNSNKWKYLWIYSSKGKDMYSDIAST